MPRPARFAGVPQGEAAAAVATGATRASVSVERLEFWRSSVEFYEVYHGLPLPNPPEMMGKPWAKTHGFPLDFRMLHLTGKKWDFMGFAGISASTLIQTRLLHGGLQMGLWDPLGQFVGNAEVENMDILHFFRLCRPNCSRKGAGYTATCSRLNLIIILHIHTSSRLLMLDCQLIPSTIAKTASAWRLSSAHSQVQLRTQVKYRPRSTTIWQGSLLPIHFRMYDIDRLPPGHSQKNVSPLL